MTECRSHHYKGSNNKNNSSPTVNKSTTTANPGSSPSSCCKIHTKTFIYKKKKKIEQAIVLQSLEDIIGIRNIDFASPMSNNEICNYLNKIDQVDNIQITPSLK